MIQSIDPSQEQYRAAYVAVAQVQDGVEDGAIVCEVHLLCERNMLRHGLSEDGVEQAPPLAAIHRA